MKTLKSLRAYLLISVVLISTVSLAENINNINNIISIQSPKKKNSIHFKLEHGIPYYAVNHKGNSIIKWSRLGIEFKQYPSLGSNLKVIENKKSESNTTWEQPWGEERFIKNNYTELVISAKEAFSNIQIDIIFRAYDDGVAFRYALPKQANVSAIDITNEMTEFNFVEDYEGWWIPAYDSKVRYENLHRKTKISELDTIHTPFTMESKKGLAISIHEAALTNFASMTLESRGKGRLKANLVPWSDGIKVKLKDAFKTPWRTIQLADKATDLITSYLILNLNEPNKLGDVSWVKPAKYIGIWWAMHVKKYSWGSGLKHGATTENTKRYIDFASKHGFDGVLVEGWNIGWDNWPKSYNDFNYTKTYPDFDMKKLSKYAKRKKVGIIGHHETAGNSESYENQLEDAFAYYKKYGIKYVKSGYVGATLNKVEWHHGQYGVNHYRKVVETAAKYGIMMDVHEPIKPTGIRRTYPNMMSREGARGMEFDAWDKNGGNPVSHILTIPFTRGLAGPFDFTPGIFDVMIAGKPNNRSNMTLAKQLSAYVLIYSPLHMAADLPENYENNPAFQFIKDVPTDWETTKVLDGSIAENLVIVRKDRDTDNWFLGAATSESIYKKTIALDFLTPEKMYEATLYKDAEDTDLKTNPTAFIIEKIKVKSTDKLPIHLISGGGLAVSFKAI
ncbi:glycoside hydrolase family 97 protein [Tamlana sp. 2201CG12-4]|uniref:glycoside hydrolase family 97 protein n=1 Tax=Tamlana sp. 2201CG12-4 TaxID=3112582 RepID=UPI002DB61B88|nr:glycoside hydrolase family 97 protein [Tamlana sp. 2201CG12-4]MEC3908669.1 glycoside hydrolase family 97 protein [Tamlana sp. 2201CG12-4]